MVVAKAINYRADGRKYPVSPPDGWVFMAFAVDALAMQALAEGGSYLDFTWADADIPRQNPQLDAINDEHKAKARRRRPLVARTFGAVLASGEVKSAFSTIGGGGLTPISPDWWRTDDPLLRFRTFSIDPAEPFSERTDLPCWIWIEAASLAKAADRLKRERLGWGSPPEPPPLPRVEKYVGDDGTIEVWSFDKTGAVTISKEETLPHQPKAGRPELTTRIHKIFGDHLRSGKVADRCAWEGRAIQAEFGGDPIKAATCEDRIRRFFNMIRRDNAGDIVNAAEVLEAMNFPINPDFPLYKSGIL